MNAHKSFGEQGWISGVVALAVIEAALGVLLATFGELVADGGFVHALLRDAGIALLVGALLTATFELVTRTRFNTEFRRAIDEILGAHRRSIWSGALPAPSIFDQLNRFVIDEPCIRRDYRLKLTLRESDHEARVRVWATGTFSLVNLDDEPHSFRHDVYVEFSTDHPEESRIEEVRVVRSEGHVDTWSADRILREQKSNATEGRIEFSPSILLDAGESVEVMTTYESLRRATTRGRGL